MAFRWRLGAVAVQKRMAVVSFSNGLGRSVAAVVEALWMPG
jgi:hypothetical protein